jgi:hypothetical protein
MAIMTDDRARAAAAAPARNFYFRMALACMATAFIGFAPTYWMPLAHRSFSANAVIHVHGLLFFAWTLYFVFQSWLVSSGQTMRHREWGILGVSFATAMTIFGVLAAINLMKQAVALGMKDAGVAFAIVPLTGIAFFAVIFTMAILARKRTETHKRLMLLAAISILDAAVARWFLTFLAPPGAVGPPPVQVAIMPALVAYLLLVVAIVRDWRTEGRPHPVYVYGGLTLVAIKFLNWPVSTTAAWHSFAGGILALAQ